MHLAFVVYGSLSEHSGGFRYDRKLVAELRERGHEVRVVGLPWKSYGEALWRDVTANLRSRLSGFDAVLEDHLCHPSLIRANRTLDAPVVSVVHHLRSSEPRAAWKNAFYRAVERRYFRTVDAAVCNSEATRRSVEALCRLPTAVAYPAGDRFADSGANRSPCRDFDGPLRLVFLGNLIERKGVHVLLSGLAAVSGDWHLTVVGAPTDEAYTERVRGLRDRLGLRERVAFTGRLPDEEIATRLARSHVLAVPSLYEGLGLVYLEGMAFGLPAVATMAGGAEEIVTDGETGFLIPPGDSDAIAEAVCTLRDDRPLLREMSEAARERYEAQSTWEETAETVDRFLADVTEAKGVSVG